MIPDDVIAQIRGAADIVAVIGQHVQLKKAGTSWKGLCPFHGERTPSFNVVPAKQFFHCFGCQKHGDVFSFLMELEGKSFVEVAEQLAGRFGIAVPRVEESPELRRMRGERLAMLELNKLAAAFFREVLADPRRGEPGIAYLARRGVTPETAVDKKGKLLFRLAPAREAMHAKKRAVLVEGNFDVITLYQAGFTEVVAPLGTALTLEQVNVLKRLTERIVLLYDGDRAGYKATMHALQLCVEADVEVLVARRPGHAKSGGAGMLADGVDPDSLVAGGGAEVLREAIDRAQGGIEFFAFEVWSKARANADARTRALEDAGRLLAKVANP